MARRFQPNLTKDKSLVVMVIVTDGVRYVAVFNPDKSKRGWVFPGGHVFSGESLEEVAAKSLQDEIGLEISPDSLEYIRDKKKETMDFVSFKAVVSVQVLNDLPRRGGAGHEIKVLEMPELRRIVQPTRIAMMQP